ncbi:hypothetical protein IBT47_20920 [Erwinia sp. S43]|uniref:hypothetical protein n=1 Tax=unclassified Erwinia TaxID=2622719 RepID=UPI00190A2602|nr:MULTISPECIES: hypothetical protein [unclassified Erwinia]MBK0034755.1 hypothetical protein [Erwinia sp. S43]MCW1877510.1 hypothetical protein [Erwinia sp. INIA01]
MQVLSEIELDQVSGGRDNMNITTVINNDKPINVINIAGDGLVINFDDSGMSIINGEMTTYYF